MTLRNDMSKHRVFVQRLVSTEVNNIKDFLSELQEQAKREIVAGTYGKSLKDSLRKVMKALPDVATQNMLDIANYEAKFAAKTFSKYIEGEVATPSSQVLKKALTVDKIAVNNVKFKNGSVLSVDNGATRKSLITAYKQFGQRKADEIVQVIKDAQVKRLTMGESIKLVEERIAGLHSAQARSLANLAINYSTNIAKSQVIEENRDIIAQEIWVRDIEADSCSECESLDGQIEEAGSFESPPIHWGCKCEVIPYVE